MPRRRTGENAAGGQTAPPAGRFSYDGLDRVMHEKARLGILASLATNARGLVFNDLKQMCSLTDGNLSRHLAVLGDDGLVETLKGTAGRRPQTTYRLTAGGRRRFAEYIGVLEKVVADAQADVRPEPRGRRMSAGWSPA
jgi:DNA-binding MarR family transcriptional regulator